MTTCHGCGLEVHGETEVAYGGHFDDGYCITALRARVAALSSQVEMLVAALEAAKRPHDSSCPKRFAVSQPCVCGAVEHNAAIDRARDTVRSAK